MTMNVLGMFFISFLYLGINVGQECPPLYQRYSQRHTYCLPPKNTCKILRNKVKANSIEIILREHNAYRSRVATGQEYTYPLPKASNMLQMVWDDEMAAVAQKHANQCVFDHDCDVCRRVKNFDVGQNLYERTVYPQPPKVNWTKAVKSWYDELKDFGKEQIDCFKDGAGPPPTGHLTQMLWANSWRVGCGYTMHKRDDQYVELYVCNYGPAGNIKDKTIYEKGEPCTGCPINSCCGKACSPPSFPGLCKIFGNDAPQHDPPEEAIFFCSFNGEPDCDWETTSGVDRWKVHKTLSGSFIGIVLNGGESSTLTFTNSFSGKESICIISYFRKGPQVAGQDGTNIAQQIITIPETGYTFKTKFKSDSVDFTKFSLTLTNWKMPSKCSIDFSVPAGEPPQYLEVTGIEVREGPCQKTKNKVN